MQNILLIKEKLPIFLEVETSKHTWRHVNWYTYLIFLVLNPSGIRAPWLQATGHPIEHPAFNLSGI
jgi:hypothetical protein